MKLDISESVWLNDQTICSALHLTEVSGLTSQELEDLIDNGVIVPVGGMVEQTAFYLQDVHTANLARKLRDDFELDLHGMVLAMTLLRRIEQLEAELSAARAIAAGSSDAPECR
ncbi:chaperone modulatory protein CbpM [Actimicrobium sp. GrIS 1.19]|uniref:chaperone modulator CbpM n=1 Tax=Actimicrobium sp. GrIS 1.19 TaxID=3071708 RepID=UPI002DFD3596|nr:chaperone modulatory protein CbpM [Actimicrobium sp. GrIS 1.19]